MADFLVERYWPGVTAADVRRLGDQLGALGGEVSYVGAALVPADEVAFFAFHAPDSARVREAVEAAGLRCDRVVAAEFL